jgi:hypothetical protein
MPRYPPPCRLRTNGICMLMASLQRKSQTSLELHIVLWQNIRWLSAIWTRIDLLAIRLHFWSTGRKLQWFLCRRDDPLLETHTTLAFRWSVLNIDDTVESCPSQLVSGVACARDTRLADKN